MGGSPQKRRKHCSSDELYDRSGSQSAVQDFKQTSGGKKPGADQEKTASHDDSRSSQCGKIFTYKPYDRQEKRQDR